METKHPANVFLEVSQQDVRILLSLTKERLRKQEKYELKSQVINRPISAVVRFEIKRLRQLIADLEKSYHSAGRNKKEFRDESPSLPNA